MKLPATLDIIPGFRIVPESSDYPIRESSESGFLKYFTEMGEVRNIKFHLVNTLCRADEMNLFNLAALNTKVLEKVNGHVQSGAYPKAFSVHWEPMTGIYS
jgi:hypothetical protein